jgi:hypothetical protein
MWDVGNDLSRRMAEFNTCLPSAHAAGTVVTPSDQVYALNRNN